jgi:hypothetical protein
MIRAAIASLVLAAASAAHAGGTQTGTVLMHHTTYAANASSAGIAMFVLVGGGAKVDKPACNTYQERWAFNNASPAARYHHAVLLAAVASGKTVTVWGTGLCDVWSDSETIMDVRINNN